MTWQVSRVHIYGLLLIVPARRRCFRLTEVLNGHQPHVFWQVYWALSGGHDDRSLLYRGQNFDLPGREARRAKFDERLLVGESRATTGPHALSQMPATALAVRGEDARCASRALSSFEGYESG